MKCPNCGRDLAPGAKFCGICGEVVRVKKVEPPPSANSMPNGISLGVGECVVKQYKIGRYTFRRGSIDVIVTNKRVIRYEESNLLGMQNNVIDDINIDSVHGNYIRIVRSISIMGLIAAFVLLIVGLVFLFARPFGYYKADFEYIIGLAALALTAIIIIKSLKPSLIFGLMGSIGSDALETCVNLRGRLFRGGDNSRVFQFKPTPETVVMLKEIGACIYDLKTLGDKAIEKWRK